MHKSGWVLLPLLTSACVSPSAEPPAFDPCEPLVIAAAPDASPDERASLDVALGLWRAEGRIRATTAESPGAPRLLVSFRSAPLAFFGVYEPSGIAVNRGLTDAEERAVVLAHELGHAYGLVHVDDPQSVMQAGNLRVPPGAGDAAALVGLWGECPAAP